MFLSLILSFSFLIGGDVALAGTIGTGIVPPNTQNGQATAATSTYTGLNKGLVGYWTMDGKDINWTSATAGTIRDRSGNGNTGNFSGMTKVGSPVPGKISQAILYTGATPCISLTASQAIYPLRNNLTVSAWIKPTNLIGSHQIFSSNSAGDGFGLATNGSGLRFTTRSVKDYSSTLINLATSTWYQVTSVMDASNNVTFYVNGISVQTVNGTTQGNLGGTGYSVGCRSDVGQYFAGLIDEVRVYNRALSAQEIKQLYDIGAGNKTNLAPAPPNTQNGQATAATSTYTGLNRGLVGYWTMDGKDINWTSATAGTIRDKSGNGFTGTLSGLAKATSTTAGKVGQAMSFDGLSSSIGLGTIANLSNFSYCSWFRFSGNKTHTLFGKGDSIDAIRISILSAGNVQTVFNDATYNPDSTVNFVPNRWNYFCFVMGDGSTRKYYANGTLVSSGAYVSLAANGARNTYIGKRGAGADKYYFRGQIDDVRIYNRALTAQEIKQLYDMGAGNKTNLAPAPPNTQNGQATAATSTYTGLNRGLVGYWTMDGKDINWTSATAGTIIDRSGNGVTGTFVNMSRLNSPAKGKIGQSLNFNASTNNSITVTNTPAMNSMTLVSVSSWVYPTGANVNRRIATTENDSVSKGYRLDFGAESLKPQFGIGDGVSVVGVAIAPTALPVNKWSHLLGVADGSNVYIYVNGTMVNSVQQTSALGGINNLVIGKRPGSSSSVFNGLIDDLRIYNRALSAQEVKQLYNMGR